MINWKELGEVPDSEEEDGFDSQEFDETSAPVAAKTAATVRDAVIWDFPDSEEDEDGGQQHRPGRPGTLTVLVPGPSFDLPDSSPLSSAPSEQDVTPVDQLMLSHSYVWGLGSSELGEPFGTSSSQGIPRGDESPSLVQAPTESTHTPLQDQTIGGDAQYQDARRVAVGYERSLRPRKPIQQHPYLLENAHYSSLLKEHDVRPLKIAGEDERRRRQQTLQDDYSEEDTQESAQRAPLDESQSNAAGGSFANADEFDFPSSSPPKASSLNNHVHNSSQTSSHGDTDNTSILDQDLPDLQELLSLPPRLVSKSTEKRQATSPPPTMRKRRRMDVVDSDPAEPIAARGRISGSADPFTSPSHLRLRHASPKSSRLPQPQYKSPESGKNRPFASKLPAVGQIIDVSSDDEGIVEPASGHAETQVSSSSGSDSESDEEVVNTIGRRIKGVLPASWLRLDQQSGRDKAQKDAKRRQRRFRSPERENRRGVAQLRQALPGSTSTKLLFDESDESDVEAPILNTTDNTINSQTRLMLGPGPTSDVPTDVYEQAVWDDGDSIVEDDSIDLMLPGNPRKKRQLTLPQPLQGDTKRPRATKSQSKLQRRKTSKQPKITSHWHLPQVSPSSGKSRSVGRRGASGVSRTSTRPSGNLANRATTRFVPPNLSILDVIESDAPKFLKIAARTAKRRQNQGRSSPRRKTIQLATRQDHIDAVSALHDWRAGSIPQRPAVTASSNSIQKQRRPQPLAEGSVNRLSKPRPPKKPTTTATRKFAKQVRDDGSVSYQAHEVPRKASARLPLQKNDTRQAHFPMVRMAQLEMHEGIQAASGTFHSRKRLLDRLYRGHRLVVPLTPSVAGPGTEHDGPAHATVPSFEQPEVIEEAPDAEEQMPARNRIRKRVKPRRLDTEAPQYSHANDPLPLQYSPEPEQTRVHHQGGKLLGLGPYGTNYTHHFEIFPLDPRVYFHESTLIGSGMIETCAGTNCHAKLLDARPRISFNLGNQILRWGPWDSQVSSELGIVLDFVAEQMEIGGNEGASDSHPTLSVAAVTFILSYVTDAMSFSEEEKAKSFAARMHECLGSFNERISPQLRQIVQGSSAKSGLALKVYERLLLIAFAVLNTCNVDSSALMAEQFQMEELLKTIAKTLLSILSDLGARQVRTTYEDLNTLRLRERGLRDDTPVIHTWVVAMKVLEMSHIPRSSFWELAQTVIVSRQVMSGDDARDHERVWELLFTLLPLVEFNNEGVVITGRRHDMASDGWAIPQQLLKRVFQLYKENARQSPSFNNYCRALLGRCHYLVQQWGWRRSAMVVGAVFDFFGSQDLGHLRNEEVYESPRFLEELAGRPTLDVEPNDNCFHIFLKLVAISVRKLRDVGATKDIRNLVARTLPNHNRQHLKDRKVHARDLAALRNHHDLLATLFWAAPMEVRPAVNLIERLVIPESSHKEACLINIRCWSQLARFIVASGEATTSFKSFGQWRNVFFQRMLRQFDSVASDVQEQLQDMAKDISKSISKDMIESIITRNKATVMDVLYASVAASLDVMRHAPDLEAATFSWSTSQLQSIFKHFAVAPPELDWGALRACLAILDSFLCKFEEFKENEESQQSESQILNSAQADEAIQVVDHEISSSYFHMARCVLSSQIDKDASARTRFDKANCKEHIVALSARIGTMFIKCGIMRLADLFKVGKYGLFQRAPPDMDLDQRRYLALFASTLLKHGLDDFSEAGFTLVELWVLSLVKPQGYLGYETQLAEQLYLHGNSCVPDAVVGLAVRLDYNTNRDLFEYAVSDMRKSIRDAGPALEQILKTEHTKTLKLVMELIKGDLKTTSQNASDHQSYVTFVQDIVSIIKTHGICAVDGFFYQISKEYSPSVQDPQLRVAGLISYGLRLREDDDKSGHVQQLFHLLYNNVKFLMINDKLKDEVSLLRKGMKHQGIMDFALGKMLPAIIGASLKNSAAFPLMDVYAEALRLLFTKKTVAHELSECDLPQVVMPLHAAIVGMEGLGRSDVPLSGTQLHVVRQVMGVLNLLWPSLHIMSASDVQSSAWAEVSQALERFWGFASTAEAYLRGLIATGDNSVQPGQLFAGMWRPQARGVRLDLDVNIFTENIVQDIAKNWNMTAHKIAIQAPENNRSGVATPGIAIAPWDMGQLLRDLQEQTREYCWWWQKVYGVASCIEGLESVVF